jgi:hypothetical protein
LRYNIIDVVCSDYLESSKMPTSEINKNLESTDLVIQCDKKKNEQATAIIVQLAALV